MARDVALAIVRNSTNGTVTLKDYWIGGSWASAPSKGQCTPAINGKKGVAKVYIYRRSDAQEPTYRYRLHLVPSGTTPSKTAGWYPGVWYEWSKVSTVIGAFGSSGLQSQDSSSSSTWTPAYCSSCKINYNLESGLTATFSLGSCAMLLSASAGSYYEATPMSRPRSTNRYFDSDIDAQYVDMKIGGLAYGEKISVTNASGDRFTLIGDDTIRIALTYDPELEVEGYYYPKSYGDTATITVTRLFPHEDIVVSTAAIDGLEGQTLPEATFTATSNGTPIIGVVSGGTTTFSIPKNENFVVTYTGPDGSGAFVKHGFGSGENPSQTYTGTAGETDVPREVTYYFKRKVCEVTHAVAETSEDAVASGAATQMTLHGGGDPGTLKYGDQVVLTAPEPVSANYEFSGWYANGEAIDGATNRTYIATLDDDVDFEARYSAKTIVSKDENNGTGYFSINGTDYTGNDSVTSFFELGSTVEIGAQATSGVWYYWKKDNDVMEMLQTGEIIIDGVHTYTTYFVNEIPVFHVACMSVANTGSEPTGIGELNLTGSSVEEETEAAYEAATGTSVEAGDNDHFYNVTGVSACMFVPERTGSLGLLRIAVGGVDSETSIADVTARVVITSNATFTAVWGEIVNFTVTAASEDDGKGTAQVAGEGGTGGSSATIAQFSNAVAVATPKSGYTFAGWYEDGTRKSTDNPWTFEVLRNVTLQARFIQDSSAICAWEGSTERKLMEWTSKVYTLPKPFDPVAARVDATCAESARTEIADYNPGVELSVCTHSSPNAPLMEYERQRREHEITVLSQDGRRLPRMRPERYLQVGVSSRLEIDAVVVGTNMAEVN